MEKERSRQCTRPQSTHAFLLGRARQKQKKKRKINFLTTTMKVHREFTFQNSQQYKFTFVTRHLHSPLPISYGSLHLSNYLHPHLFTFVPSCHFQNTRFGERTAVCYSLWLLLFTIVTVYCLRSDASGFPVLLGSEYRD
jgi:hypothetical protein